jgi:5-methylcytosine-specific restriction enzyme A
MTLEEQLHEEMVSLYRRIGEATGNYWPQRFHQAVKRNGGLAVAKKLLGRGPVSSGFDRLAQVHRADLSVEAVALTEPYRRLFTDEELVEAKRRLDQVPKTAFPQPVKSPDQDFGRIDQGNGYGEGAVTQVLVNQYERSASARNACTAHHGFACAVCGFDFEERYGEIGREFIHVHHKRPLSRLSARYQVNPVKDLVPVCPNCHAMLHRQDPPLDVEQLRRLIRSETQASTRDPMQSR